MNTLEKLRILGAGAKYDTSCGTDTRKRFPDMPAQGIYNAVAHTKCMPMLKVLQSNKCLHDCKYCVNSRTGIGRASFEPWELARVFSEYRKKGYVEGIFLSSGVEGDPDRATEKMIETAEIIRNRQGFRGYMHLKALPGSSRENIRRLCELADRVSINIEAPTSGRLNELSGTKNFGADILRRMGWLKEFWEKGVLRSYTTQYVVGANDETDLEYLEGAMRLYKEYGLWRAYYSGFIPVTGTPLERGKPIPMMREHSLYQADWLLRVYGFDFAEVREVMGDSGMLPLGKDLKMEYAEHMPDLYPIDVNGAKYTELVRVPGIGPTSAERIIRMRNDGKRVASLSDLRDAGVVLKRAMNYVTIDGNGRQSRLREY